MRINKNLRYTIFAALFIPVLLISGGLIPNPLVEEQSALGVGVCAFYKDGSEPSCMDSVGNPVASEAIFSNPDDKAIDYLEIYVRVSPVYSGVATAWDVSSKLEVSAKASQQYDEGSKVAEFVQDWSGHSHSGIAGQPPVPDSGDSTLVQKVRIVESKVDQWAYQDGSVNNFVFKATVTVTLYDVYDDPTQELIGESQTAIGLIVRSGAGTVILSSLTVTVQPCAMIQPSSFWAGDEELRCVGG